LSNKKFIINADDFGISKELNKAVLKGHLNGFLTSTSICANGEAFDSAVYEIIPECPNLGIGVHLNIIEGNSLLDGEPFTKGYGALILSSYNKKFLQKVEAEFRLQIEKIMKFTKISHIDSHVHVHAIPNYFEITCKLAKEYGIKQVRTQYENFYITPNLMKHLNFKYPPNLLKIALLNSFTLKNKKLLKEYDLKTNDYLIGVGYTGLMDDKTVLAGLESLPNEDMIVESLIHPHFYQFPEKNNQHYKEFLITQNKDLQDKIRRLGFVITNYKGL
jgi:hypothetical protein